MDEKHAHIAHGQQGLSGFVQRHRGDFIWTAAANTNCSSKRVTTDAATAAGRTPTR